MVSKSSVSYLAERALPWWRGYSYVLGRKAEYLHKASSILGASKLLAFLQRRLKGTSLNKCVRIGSYDYMLVHDTIVRVRGRRRRRSGVRY